jgi:hypothetical protein
MDLARATNLPPPETAADRFNRGIKRDPSQFKTFQNELYWDAWYRGFSATATAQGLANVLNHSYVPSNPNDLELFSSQQTYMYSVLIDRLQTDNARSILRDHEVDKDSQLIIAEVVRYYEKSSMAKNRSSTLFSQITSMKIHNTRWNGTIRNFILHWVDKVREYHRLAGPSNQITDAMKKTILPNLVKADSKLNDVIIRDMQRQRDGEPEYPYEVFLEHLLQTADIIDGTLAPSKRTTSVNLLDRFGSNVANFFEDGYVSEDDEGNDELVFQYTKSNRREEFRPTVDKNTWNSLSIDDQRAWNALSPDGKKKVAKFFSAKVGQGSHRVRI